VETTEKGKIHLLENGHVTTPKGFRAGGVHCGIRKIKLDFGWVYSETPASAAGVYTLNKIQASPLKVTKQSIATDNQLQAVVVNSGVANSVTGSRGYQDALQMQREAAAQMRIDPDHVGVLSTGVIGVPLPMEKIHAGIQEINNPENESAERFESAILTTDTKTKHLAVELTIDGKTITIGGAAKGSGMIDPNMATMFAFLTTDAAVEPASLQKALGEKTDETFNMITVDGDCSTNDTVLVMANGTQKNQPLNESHPDWELFLKGFQMVSEELAKAIARDGEGATKLVETNVKGAPDAASAKQVAKAVISSNLVKTAVYGADPNWGRIICAVGYSEQPIDPDKITISIGDIPVVIDGLPTDFDEMEGKLYMQNDTVVLSIDLQNGPCSATAWGCDLTYDYVKINASYRT